MGVRTRPTDEAFAKLPEGTVESLLKPENKEKLVAILTYHVVPGKVLAADVVKLSEAKTVQGGKVTIAVKDGKVKPEPLERQFCVVLPPLSSPVTDIHERSGVEQHARRVGVQDVQPVPSGRRQPVDPWSRSAGNARCGACVRRYRLQTRFGAHRGC